MANIREHLTVEHILNVVRSFSAEASLEFNSSISQISMEESNLDKNKSILGKYVLLRRCLYVPAPTI